MTTDSSLSCPGCGTSVVGAARFCMQCGVAVTDAGLTSGADDRLPNQVLERLGRATLGEYRILSELGRGGMAAVYLAEDLALGRRVAIKVMIPGLAGTDGMADRFLLEARTAAQLSHPNIIPIYAVRTTGRLRYFAMKYIAGRSLDRVLAEAGPLPVAVVQAVLAQVGSALDHAHRRGVVHRDIKPANILLDEDGTAIVADFGIAKVSQGTGLTQTGSTVGTPTYMSPEQCTGRLVTGASDQYALGCVAFELLAGRPPFVHQEVVPVLLAHVSEVPPPLLQFRPDCPIELAAVVDKMLAKDPVERWPSLAEALEAAECAAHGVDAAIRVRMRELSGADVLMAPPPIASIPVSPLPLSRTVATVPPVPMDPGAEVHSPSEPQSAEAVIEVQGTCGRLVIVPGEGALAVGQVVCLMAFRRKDDGDVRPAAEVVWSSSDPSVLRVAPDGEATAHRPGVARVTASSAGQAAEVSFQVSRVDVAQVRITPGIATLGAGEAVRLEALAIDRLGMSLQGRIVTWSSSQPEVAAVGPDGVLRGFRPGTVRVSAAIGGGLAWTEVRVTPVRVQGVKLEPGALLLRVGESAAVRATVLAIRGGTVAGVPVEWQSSDPAIAAITPDGMVSGVRFGIARIAASAGGRRATIPVEVRAAASVSSPRLPLGTT